ncbi:abscisic acid-deficient protein Aba4 family protein [Oricola sp.]|uniref:abscisic acid-deficient protein Aba4 family protein n=1 Tax=Oricola sp. TaxID=1979950 RepID=UPI003BA990DA
MLITEARLGAESTGVPSRSNNGASGQPQHSPARSTSWLFDLFIGAWVCRTARAEGIASWTVLPCLPLIFLFGPAGFVAFWTVRFVKSRFVGQSADDLSPELAARSR